MKPHLRTYHLSLSSSLQKLLNSQQVVTQDIADHKAQHQQNYNCTINPGDNVNCCITIPCSTMTVNVDQIAKT